MESTDPHWLAEGPAAAFVSMLVERLGALEKAVGALEAARAVPAPFLCFTGESGTVVLVDVARVTTVHRTAKPRAVAWSCDEHRFRDLVFTTAEEAQAAHEQLVAAIQQLAGLPARAPAAPRFLCFTDNLGSTFMVNVASVTTAFCSGNNFVWVCKKSFGNYITFSTDEEAQAARGQVVAAMRRLAGQAVLPTAKR
jgi:hypothetical protein